MSSSLNPLNSMPLGERPQERLRLKGPTALSDAELLAIILRSGTRGCDVLSLSHQILRGIGSLRGLLRLTTEDLCTYRGIGGVKALQMQAMIEIARRILSTGEAAPLMDSPERVFQWLRPMVDGEAVEKFWVLSLNRKNRLLRCEAVTSGTATASLVHPREVFREAIRHSASALICAHNHPSGDPSPSQADIRATRQLREAARVIQLDLLDHVIVGQREHDPQGTGYYSFAEAGLL
jgi:DNA repair protein RadC